MYFRKTVGIFVYISILCAAALISHNFLYGFLFITIHEICHVICASILGYNFKTLKLLPFGITANIKEEFIRPVDDIIISLSGPMINFIFFVVFFILEINFGSNFKNLKEINLILFIFNLVPAEFLDGGRILRTLLKLFTSFYKAYIITVINGVIIGTAILFLSVYTKSLLNGIILFVTSAYILYSCYISKKEILLNVIRDNLMKNKYIRECLSLNVMIKAFNGNANLLQVIKCFSFKRYYIIYLIENGLLESKFYESDIIKIYCSQGNIKLKECMKYINT